MIPAISLNKNNTQTFQGLNISKNISVGLEYIEKDMKALNELGKNYNIKISQGTEYITDGITSVSRPCLDVIIKPLKRSLNPLVRLFGTDTMGGTFQLAWRESRTVEASIISLAERLANQVSARMKK